MGFFKKVFSAISKAGRESFVFEEDKIKFLINKEEYFSYDLFKYDLKNNHSPYTSKAYTLSNSELFLESIKSKNDADWEGHPRSVYEGFFKSELKINSMQLEKREEFEHYEFSTYKINDSFILHLIYIWSANKNTFIFDSQGKLFTSLLKQYKEDYAYEYEDEEKGEINFDISLVKVNALKNYIRKDT